MKEEKRKEHHRRMHQRAKELRQRQTSAEEKLWKMLRKKHLGGYKFRRQHPVGPFIVDFYCSECKLIIELDGRVHDKQKEYDQARDRWLVENGYRILRFENDIIENDHEGVAAEILEACERSS